MPIYAPGKRDRKNNRQGTHKREIVAILSLTAMVDMFTVLTVFLLQNYSATGQAINIPKEVQLPHAQAVKELKPANVVTLSLAGVTLNDKAVAQFSEVKDQKDWLVKPLFDQFARELKAQQEKRKTLKETLQKAVSPAPQNPEQDADLTKVTLQADKNIDFLSVKKIMFTLTEAGAKEINFAVIKKEGEEKPVAN